MDSISLRSKSLYHVRSVSLPSCHHQFSPQVDEHLSRLRSSQSTSSSLSSIGNKLNILEEMYDSLDDILQLPHTQQAFVKNEKWIEGIFDGYTSLLDLCNNVKEISSHTKEDVQELISVLRRRRATNEIGKYLTSRKAAQKGIQKSLKNLKNIKFSHKNAENEVLGALFIVIEEASFEVFESMMSYIAGTKSQSRLSNLVANKFFQNNASFKGEVANMNEFKKVDDEVDFLIKRKAEKIENSTKFENLHSQLTTMESNLQDLEEGLESLFRRLIKTRVALLNLLNN